MQTRSMYLPGVPCWVDTMQPDPEAAKEFYGELFGWRAERVPASEYRIVTTGEGHPRHGGITAARDAGPYVIFSVIVDDVAAACTRAEELGGKVESGPFHPQSGPSNAYLLDREGNRFGVYSPPAG